MGFPFERFTGEETLAAHGWVPPADLNALRTAPEWAQARPTITPPVDIFICDQPSGSPINTGTGAINFDQVGGTWNYQVPFSLGGTGMQPTAITDYHRDSVGSNGPIASNNITLMVVLEVTTAPTADLMAFSKKQSTTDFPGMSMHLRNDGFIFGMYDSGPVDSFESIDQGVAGDLVSTWAIAQTRGTGATSQILIRETGQSVQASTASTYAYAFGNSGLWTLGSNGNIDGVLAIYRSVYRFDYQITEADFTTITDSL